MDFSELPTIIEKRLLGTDVWKPSAEELKAAAEPFARKTEYGSLAFASNVKNRSAKVTAVLGSREVASTNHSERQSQIVRNAEKTIEKALAYLRDAPLLSIERTMGDNAEFAPRCTLLLSTYRKECVRLAHLWGETLAVEAPSTPPRLYLICIPEWPESDRQVLSLPEQNCVVVLGSDYAGEIKMGFLRTAMWHAKQRGLLGLHAGSKIVNAVGDDGKKRRYGVLLFGLSGTGKSTHSCHAHGLNREGEGIEILQDDIVFLKKDGGAFGTERGFYLKTDSLSPDIQPLLHNAAIQPRAVFENVRVDYENCLHFQDVTLTSNARGVIQFTDLAPYAGKSINLPSLDSLDGLLVLFITRRNTVIPVMSRLTAEQAAATFMLGESVETSAGDPTQAGKSLRVVGTNPFIIGDPSLEGNYFYDFVKKHGSNVQCFLMNTGGLGEVRNSGVIERKSRRITIPEMASVIRALVRDQIRWTPEPLFGMQVPEKVEGVDDAFFNALAHYSKEDALKLASQMKKERAEHLKKFKKLNPVIGNQSLSG
ncbi:phosphoenolpyruvate carboxykinase [Candidatus Micrarchaeota archaeon]|nr:phosphoenolpyruvate carboxykinase [Candidatus Micrarchaeota archaeon]